MVIATGGLPGQTRSSAIKEYAHEDHQGAGISSIKKFSNYHFILYFRIFRLLFAKTVYLKRKQGSEQGNILKILTQQNLIFKGLLQKNSFCDVRNTTCVRVLLSYVVDYTGDVVCSD